MPEQQKVEISSKEIVEKIIKQLTPTGWYDILRYWFIDPQMEEIIDTLKQYTNNGDRWVPGIKNVFRWMISTPYDKVRMVFLVDESSNLLDYNTGIPLHSEPIVKDGKTVKLSASWTADSLQWSMGVPKEERNYNLLRWTEQGVLLVPLASTCRSEGMPHYKLWESMIPRIIEKINLKGDIPIILIGEKSIVYEDYFTSRHVRCIKKKSGWSDHGWSQWVDQVMEETKQKPIKWI